MSLGCGIKRISYLPTLIYLPISNSFFGLELGTNSTYEFLRI